MYYKILIKLLIIFFFIFQLDFLKQYLIIYLKYLYLDLDLNITNIFL